MLAGRGILGGMSDSTPVPDSLPRWLWPLTLGGAALTALIVGVGALALLRGAADPPVAGPVVWADSTLAWAGGSTVAFAPGESAWIAAPGEVALPRQAFTLSVAARIDPDDSASRGATWGIWAEDGEGARIVWAVRGDGTLTIRRCPASAPVHAPYLFDCPALIPEWRWHAYPRILPPGRANTLTLHREAGGIRLRINGEILGLAGVNLGGPWGLWAQAGESAPVTFNWLAAELRVARR